MCVSPPNGPSAMVTDRLQSNLSCVLLGPGKVRFERRPTPQIVDPHDVLVQIGYVGVCGSDVSSLLLLTNFR